MTQDQIYLIFISCIAALIFGGVAYLFFRQKYPYFAKDTLLTKSELHFYESLKQVTPSNVGIAFKVRLADLISCDDKNWGRGYGRHISAKHIDFTLYDIHTTQILACIELDDRSHDRPDRKRRDKFVNNAFLATELALIRVRTQKHYNLAALKKDLFTVL